jgi:putative addiction module component (TIGR02574 family)
MMIATEKLTRTEKLQLIEQLWDELSRSPEEVESPAWHADALSEAERAAANGKAGFQDWDQAKERLRKA